jgi:hypothetical protein
MAYGKQAARNIDMQLMESNRWNRIFPDLEYEQSAPEEPSSSHRRCGQTIAASVRARSNEEVVAGMNEEEVLDEVSRCLRCDVIVGNVS